MACLSGTSADFFCGYGMFHAFSLFSISNKFSSQTNLHPQITASQLAIGFRLNTGTAFLWILSLFMVLVYKIKYPFACIQKEVFCKRKIGKTYFFFLGFADCSALIIAAFVPPIGLRDGLFLASSAFLTFSWCAFIWSYLVIRFGCKL